MLLGDMCAGMQMVFEEFGFRSYLAQPAQALSLRAWGRQRPDLAASRARTGLVIDAGFSFTHAVPVADGRVLSGGVRRINVGGKALTNFLKELVSYRRAAARSGCLLAPAHKHAIMSSGAIAIWHFLPGLSQTREAAGYPAALPQGQEGEIVLLPWVMPSMCSHTSAGAST